VSIHGSLAATEDAFGDSVDGAGHWKAELRDVCKNCRSNDCTDSVHRVRDQCKVRSVCCEGMNHSLVTAFRRWLRNHKSWSERASRSFVAASQISAMIQNGQQRTKPSTIASIIPVVSSTEGLWLVA